MGAHTIQKKSVGAHTSQRQAAIDAGFSKHQQVQAVRVANISQDDFDASVEAENPPSITKLADQGRKPQDLPEGYHKAGRLIGEIDDFHKFCSNVKHVK